MFDDVIRDAEESKWGSHDHSLWVITIRHSRCSLEGCSVNNRSFAECAGDSSSWSHTTIVHVHESMFAFTQRCSHNNCSRSHDDVLTTIVHVHMTMFTRRCSHDNGSCSHGDGSHSHDDGARSQTDVYGHGTFTVMQRLRSCDDFSHSLFRVHEKNVQSWCWWIGARMQFMWTQNRQVWDHLFKVGMCVGDRR